MNRKHIILKANPETTNETRSRGPSDTVAPSLPVTIEIETLPPHRALAISRARATSSPSLPLSR